MPDSDKELDDFADQVKAEMEASFGGDLKDFDEGEGVLFGKKDKENHEDSE